MEECSLDRLPELRNLENLDVNSKLNASYLADYCEANQNLVRLTFSSNEIYGKLTDIVPHCKNLEFLTFMVKEHFDDSEYTQFAKLPSLRFLNILGSYESGSLFPLLKALATKESNTLEELIIDAAPMTTECHKLKVIEIEGKHKFGDLEFIREALNTVKSVRNPKVQKAFQLRIRPFKYLTAGQIAISDKSYLTICSLD
ncbi:hypothetical protein ACLKA7_008204 [Drosophila subpalustris]